MNNLDNLTVADYFKQIGATLIPFSGFAHNPNIHSNEYNKHFIEYFFNTSDRENELVDENGEELEIFLFFFINDEAAEQIIKDNTYNVYYNDVLSTYFITIHHFGTPWSGEKVSVFKNLLA